MNKLNRILFIGACILLMTKVAAQEWVVPEDKKNKESPFRFSAETAKKGEAIFQQNCQVCHGEPTKGTFNKGLIPNPGDPATDKFQKETNGALFYKVTNGRGAMPRFMDILTEEQRWQVISYFRSFNKNYEQPAGGLNEVATSVQNALLTLSFLSATNQVHALATDDHNKPLEGAEMVLFVKRYFGNLKIGESVVTDKTGVAVFDFPKDLPGDKKGNVVLVLNLKTGGSNIQKTDTLAIGVPTNLPPLNSQRAMWNVMAKAQVWLFLSYFTVVITIWGLLIYIVFQLVKIRNENKQVPTK